MTSKQTLLVLAVLQIFPMLLWPVVFLRSGLGIVGVGILIFAGLGFALYRGRSWALTLAIFLQGLNVIIRLMMFMPNAMNDSGTWDISYVIANMIAIILSLYLLFRLDRPDVRSLIVA
jgi:hypothetical protein